MDYKLHIKPFGELSAIQLHRITCAREAVFFLQQHVSCPDADQIDLQSTFLWLESEDKVVAFLRIIPAGVAYSEASIGRVLVVEDHRHMGLCRQIMTQAIDFIATHWGAQPIRISAQCYIAPFYQSLGFQPDSQEYLEAGITHIKMIKR